jgi:hypothetical protein
MNQPSTTGIITKHDVKRQRPIAHTQEIRTPDRLEQPTARVMGQESVGDSGLVLDPPTFHVVLYVMIPVVLGWFIANWVDRRHRR